MRIVFEQVPNLSFLKSNFVATTGIYNLDARLVPPHVNWKYVDYVQGQNQNNHRSDHHHCSHDHYRSDLNSPPPQGQCCVSEQ